MEFLSENTLIIITSDEPIGDEGVTHQHYIDTLSQRFPVIFVSPPTKWSFAKLLKKRKTEKAGPVTIFHYINYLPVSLFPRLSVAFNDRINSRQLRDYLPVDKQMVFWKFDSLRMIDTRPIRPSAIIYHVRDPYFQRASDHQLARSATLVVTVNGAFMSHYQSLNKDVLYIPHGIGEYDTNVDVKEVTEIKKRVGNFFLLAGSINNDLDFRLLKMIAEYFTDYTLLIMGKFALTSKIKEQAFAELLQLPNVKLHDHVHHHQLSNFIAASVLCLVPYETNSPNFFRNPIKITNYIAQLKPVVNTVDIPELSILEDKILFTATDHHCVIEMIGEIIAGNRKVNESFVLKYIDEHRYWKLVNHILRAAEEASATNKNT